MLGADGVLLAVYCTTDGVRPDDDWLSIVSTIEFLPLEDASPPPWLGGRVELPEQGFAVTLPDDWAGFDTEVDVANDQRAAAAGFLDPAIWSTDAAAWIDGLVAVASKGVPPWICSCLQFRQLRVGPGAPGHVIQRGGIRVLRKLHSTRQRRQGCPATLRSAADRHGLPHPSPWRAILNLDKWQPASYYLLLDMGGVLVEAYCDTQDARPEDDWHSIVEAIEPLPAAE